MALRHIVPIKKILGPPYLIKFNRIIQGMRTIRIFIASSSELKEDRDQFRMFISKENDRLHSKGMYLELVQWENFLDAISDTRLQDEYNNAIRECDIVLCLFFTKVGKYSGEEFDTAYQVFKDRGKPTIWTYFKNAPINTSSITDEINTLLAFKKKIGDLGHFYTEYTNIDNLINKYRTQLDKFLPQFEQIEADVRTGKNGGNHPTEVAAAIPNTFNQLLTEKLLQAIKPFSRKADDFLATNTDWSENSQLVQTAKRILISGYVGAVGMQLRKLMSIGEEDFTQSKLKRYLENCQLTAKRALQLITFALISTLWDYQLEHKVKLSQTQTDILVKFFKDAAEEDIVGFADLIKGLLEAYDVNKLALPIPELSNFLPALKDGHAFREACTKLNTIADLLNTAAFDSNNGIDAEKNLTVVLENLNFLAAYRMISIKDIDYNQQRNDSEGLYLHNYTLLEGGSQAGYNSLSKVRTETTPVISFAVLLFKDNYRENINMDPFIIDYNALALTGGSKICFYSYCNTYGDRNLNYSFIEDTTRVSIPRSNNPKPDDKDTQAINRWLADPENRKDMNFDRVYELFHDAQKTLTGIEEAPIEDVF